MPSASMSTMRACGSQPPLRPSAYFRVPALTIPCRAPTEPRLPMPRGLPSSLPSTLRRSLPLSSMTNRGRRSRNSGSMYRSHRSRGSRMCPSASTTLYARVIGDPSEGFSLLVDHGTLRARLREVQHEPTQDTLDGDRAVGGSKAGGRRRRGRVTSYPGCRARLVGPELVDDHGG